MKRSTMGVSQQQTGTRTSSTTWLREEDEDEDEDDEEVMMMDRAVCRGTTTSSPLRYLAEKVSRLSGVPATHFENLQVVRYEPGQKFDVHTDHLDEFNDLECRGRVATCLLYLNSSRKGMGMGMGGQGESEKAGNFFRGGETYFPEYNVNIIPKRGRAVFWFNTIEKQVQQSARMCSGYEDDDTRLTVDLRSRHAGKPVIGGGGSGEKWVCNLWIHPVPLNLSRTWSMLKAFVAVQLEDKGMGKNKIALSAAVQIAFIAVLL